MWKSNFGRPPRRCLSSRVCSRAWSFQAIDATLSPSPRRSDGVEVHDNLSHWLISTQVEGTDLTFGRGPRADVALVDAARRTAGRRQFVSRRHARVRTATRWGEAVAVLKAFRRRDGRARCGVFVDGEAVGDEPVRLRAGHRVVFGSLADDDGTPYSEFAYDVVTCEQAPETPALAPDVASPNSVGSFGDEGDTPQQQRRGRLSNRRRRISLAVAVVRDDRDGLDDETDEEGYQGVCELAPAAGCFAGLFDGESLLFGGSKEEA